MLDIEKISHHFWLKHRDESSFHAFVKVHRGSKSLCNASDPIEDLQKMDLPGDFSPCCNKCSYVLYEYPQPIFEVTKQ